MEGQVEEDFMDFSPEGKRNQGCCEDEQHPVWRVRRGKGLSWWTTCGGLNGEQAYHGLTTDWAGESLEVAGWRRFLVLLVLARGVVIWIQVYEHLAQGGQALAVGMGEEAEVTYLDEAPG